MKNHLAIYLPEPHKTRDIFRSNGIPVSAVAKFLGLSSNYTCSILSGFSRATKENESKLLEFARLVESWGVENEGN